VTKACAGEPSSGSSPASQSIGVVTFNGDQQRLIENQPAAAPRHWRPIST